MVKAKRKPIDEIMEMVKGKVKILNVGCGGCVSVCLAGGQKEVGILNMEIEALNKKEGDSVQVNGYTVERQCNMGYLEELDDIVQDYDCLLSMACGAGVQLLAERYSERPVFPAVNTVFIGIDREVGAYEERCKSCGDCQLGYTGGICPVACCAKSLFNGPCGGTQGDKCEVDENIPCAWHDIYERLKAQNRIESMLRIHPPMQWQDQIQGRLVQN